MVFKEIVQGGEPIKEHKIINILQNHPKSNSKSQRIPHLLILTCGIAQTNDLFVYAKTKNRKHLSKNKGVFHLKNTDPLYKNNLKRNLKNTNKPHTSKKNITL